MFLRSLFSAAQNIGTFLKRGTPSLYTPFEGRKVTFSLLTTHQNYTPFQLKSGRSRHFDPTEPITRRKKHIVTSLVVFVDCLAKPIARRRKRKIGVHSVCAIGSAMTTHFGHCAIGSIES